MEKSNGTHILGSIKTENYRLLTEYDLVDEKIRQIITSYGFTVLGEPQIYIFLGGGYTVAMVLSESHFTIHTAPEHEMAYLDLFTCNYFRNNSEATVHAMNEIVDLFNPIPETVILTTIKR